MINHRSNAEGQKNARQDLLSKKLVIGEGFIYLSIYHFILLLIKRYYTGDLKDDGKETRLSLEDAAKKVQISKKSLDDYLLQIRLGRKFGFNFNEHYNDKVGVLRAFVKKNK